MEAGARNKKVLVLGLLALVAMAVGLVFGIILIKASIGDGSNEAIDDNVEFEEVENYDTVIEVFNAEGSASTTVSGSGK